MGLLSEGSPLSWPETEKHADHVRKHGVIQFKNQYTKLKDRKKDILYWGDEFIAVMSGITYKPPFYIGPYGKYVFPSFAEAVGWLMSLAPVCIIVLFMAIECFKKGGVKAACKPEAHWGPAHDTDRVGRYHPLSKINMT